MTDTEKLNNDISELKSQLTEWMGRHGKLLQLASKISQERDELWAKQNEPVRVKDYGNSEKIIKDLLSQIEIQNKEISKLKDGNLKLSQQIVRDNDKIKGFG